MIGETPRAGEVPNLETFIKTLDEWSNIVEDNKNEAVKKQYKSQIGGIRDLAQAMVTNTNKWNWKKLGQICTQQGALYLVFQFEAKEGKTIKLTGIVKNPKSLELVNSEGNLSLNETVHQYLLDLSPTGIVELQADTEALVKVYYKYHYRLPSVFNELTRPNSIENNRWVQITKERQPTEEERGAILSKNANTLNKLGVFEGGMWTMVREKLN